MMPLESRDKDLTELFQRTQPAERGVNVQALLFHADSECGSLYAWQPQRGRLFATIRAGVLFAVVAVVMLFFTGPWPFAEQSLAFADVQEQVERVRTVEYVETSYDGDIPIPDESVRIAEPTVAELISGLEKNLSNASRDLVEEIKFELIVLKSLQKSRVLYVRRVRIKGKHLERTDQLFPCDDPTHGYSAPPYVVRNARNGLTVSFTPSEKKRTILRKQVVIYPKRGKQSEGEIPKIPRTVDFFARFLSLPAEATEQLDERTIAGHKAVGFRNVEQSDDETWTRTYWVGTKSKLPVEIVTELRKGKELKQRWIHNRFEFDREMSDELFDTETPADYTTEDGKVLGVGQ